MTLPNWLVLLLHSPYLAIILTLGVFGDAFIGTSLFIFGEIFFIATGYAVAVTHIGYRPTKCVS